MVDGETDDEMVSCEADISDKMVSCEMVDGR